MNESGLFSLSRWRERAGVRVVGRRKIGVPACGPTLTQPSPASGRGLYRAQAVIISALLITAAGPPPGAESCTGCHAAGSGMGGLSGMPAAAIETAMQGFRDHTRPATLMNRIAPGFTPEQTHAIATWFEQQR